MLVLSLGSGIQFISASAVEPVWVQVLARAGATSAAAGAAGAA